MGQKKSDSAAEEIEKQELQKQAHEHHMHALFALFCFVALLGISTVFVHQYAREGIDGITGSVTSTINYNKCTDYGNYIILQNDAGWRKVKKDICTGVDNKFIRKAACVKPEELGYTATEKESYVYTYTKVAYCASGSSCTLDSNKAAYCPGD